METLILDGAVIALLEVGWRFAVAVIVAVALIVGAERILESQQARREFEDLTKGVNERNAQLRKEQSRGTAA